MWVYIFTSMLCSLTVLFFLYALEYPHFYKLTHNAGSQFMIAVFGVGVGFSSYYHMYYDPLGAWQRTIGSVLVMGCIFLYGLHVLHFRFRVVTIGTIAVFAVVTIQNSFLVIAYNTFPYKSDILKEFLIWIRPLIYSLDFVFLGSIIRMFGGLDLVQKFKLNRSGNDSDLPYKKQPRREFLRVVHMILVVAISLAVLYEMWVLLKWITGNYTVKTLNYHSIRIGTIIIISIFGMSYMRIRNKAKRRRIITSANYVATYTGLLNKLSLEEKLYREAIENTLNKVEQYLELEDMESLKKLDQSFSELSSNLDASTYKFLMSLMPLDHKVIKGILASKFSRIKNCGVNFEVSIGDGIEDLSIAPVDLSRMIGILLDNAIEAAVESERKHIVFIVTRNDNEIEILVKNTYFGLPDLNDLYKNGYSTKGKNRGQGLGSFKKIVNRHKHVCSVLRIEKTFFVHGIKVLI